MRIHWIASSTEWKEFLTDLNWPLENAHEQSRKRFCMPYGCCKSTKNGGIVMTNHMEIACMVIDFRFMPKSPLKCFQDTHTHLFMNACAGVFVRQETNGRKWENAEYREKVKAYEAMRAHWTIFKTSACVCKHWISLGRNIHNEM